MVREAVVAYEQLCQLDPDCALSHFVLGRAHLDEKNYSAALPLLQRCLELDPDHLLAILLTAQAHEHLEQLTQARHFYERGLNRAMTLGNDKFVQQFKALLATLCA